MPLSKSLSVLLISCALILPSQAQQRHDGPARAPRSSGSVHAPEIFRGGPRNAMGWGEFHHETAPGRITPHRFSGSNLPQPNGWRGNVRRFDLGTWQSGGWRHVQHGGRFGWWWVVGPDWYFFNQPVYPYPDLYTPFGLSIGWWYWCDPYQEYYPYITYCPVPWESVLPRE